MVIIGLPCPFSLILPPYLGAGGRCYKWFALHLFSPISPPYPEFGAMVTNGMPCLFLSIPALPREWKPWLQMDCGGGARWLSGRVSDSGARGPGFETYRRRVVSLSKTLYSPKALVNYPGSDGSVPI